MAEIASMLVPETPIDKIDFEGRLLLEVNTTGLANSRLVQSNEP
jgi:hypothetical protein